MRFAPPVIAQAVCQPPRGQIPPSLPAPDVAHPAQLAERRNILPGRHRRKGFVNAFLPAWR